MSSALLGKLLINIFPAELLVGSDIGSWYGQNPHHQYEPGDILILKRGPQNGYGIRPVIRVNGYSVVKDKDGIWGQYRVTLVNDAGGTFPAWSLKNEVPRDVARTEEEAVLGKWNVEYRFVKVHAQSLDEAVELYGCEYVNIDGSGTRA